MKKILSAIVLAGIGVVSANAGQGNWVHPAAFRDSHDALRFAQARPEQAVRYEVRRDQEVRDAQLRALNQNLCAQQAALANATAIQLSCGAPSEAVVAQNAFINQQLVANTAALQYQLQGPRYVAPACR